MTRKGVEEQQRKHPHNLCSKTTRKYDIVDEDGEDPVLQHILKQLRPFQKEAYEFCTLGILPKRNRANFQDAPKQGTFCNRKNATSTKESTHTFHDPDLIGKGRILLADEMGLGKTVTSLAIMAHYRRHDWPLLVLCPASLRYTWPGEIEKFMPSLPASSIYVVNGFDDADFYENDNKRRKIQIVVASYSLLQTRAAAAKTLQQFRFQSIIVDESHNLKQRNTQRCKLALPLLEQAKRLVLLSGTPALARPVELWTQVSTLAPRLFPNYTQFTKHYCNARRGRFGWDVNGLSNADELHGKLRQIMVRRLKADVLQELPAKQRTIIRINVTKGEKRKECESILQDLADTRQSLRDLVGEAADGANFEARKLLMEAYQASGIAKSPGVVEYLLEWLKGSGTQKVLVFAHHKGVLDALEVAMAKEYKATAHIRIDGSVSSLERAARVRKFQTSSKIRVGILSMTAAGVGLTLTAATTVMFAELHWTPGVLAQAEDRCHRIGQKNAVNILYLICQDSKVSVDSQLWKMLARKVGNLGRVIDGETNASMNVKEATKDGSLNVAKRQSAQDELQSFFSETSPNDAAGASPRVPVKGTIMSFFQKQTESKSKVTAKEHSTTPANRKASPFRPSVSKPSSSEPPAAAQSWTCSRCTFINAPPRRLTKSANGPRQQCFMCGAQRHRERENCNLATTPATCAPTSSDGKSTEPSREDPIVIEESDEEGDSDSPERAAAKSLRNPRNRRRANPATDDSDVVVLGARPGALPRGTGKRDKKLHDREMLKNDDRNLRPESGASPRKRKAGAREVVCWEESDASARRRRRNEGTGGSGSSSAPPPPPAPLLKFSVSKNSGRISIHFATTGESSLINFGMEEVLTEETANRLLDTKIHRRSIGRTTGGVPLAFDGPAIDKLTSTLCDEKAGAHFEKESLRSEVELFVSSYQSLREVEKQAIKDSGESFSHRALKRFAAKLLASPRDDDGGDRCGDGGSVQRYSGGAKERARERLEKGLADEQDKAILEGRLCAWCGGRPPGASRMSGVESTYCSRECAERGRLKRGGAFASSRVRAQVFALEGGVCRLCGIDAHALFGRVVALHPAERLNALINAGWRLPRTTRAMERLLQDPKEGDFWQADHIRAVAEGGGGCGLENLRTLCVPCHGEETEKLRGRLKLAGGARRTSEGRDERQTDIRTIFGVKK